MVQPVNPYAARAAAVAAAAPAAATEKENGAPQQHSNMGPQSQRRISNAERTHQMQSQSRKKGGQQTLFGNVAFDPTKNCPKCRGGTNSHKGNSPLCWNNKQNQNQLQQQKNKS